MRIAVSADSFSSFTSGSPVRGMILELIKMRSTDEFYLYYTQRKTLPELESFYSEINSLPNVKVCYFPFAQKEIAIRRMLCLPIVKTKIKFDVFINPGRVELWPGIGSKSICSLADLSIIRGYNTGSYSCFFRIWNKIQFAHILPKLSKIVSISYFTKNDIVSIWPELEEKIEVIYNGIDDFWFDSVYRNNPATDIGTPYFVWWGLISRRKNIDSLIIAYKQAKQHNSQLPKLLLIGSVAEHMNYIIGEFGDDIIHLPFQEPYVLKYLVKNSMGLIFPSLYEGFGLPVIEAFSQGVNVACSNVTSLPEIADGRAVLFDPHNVSDIRDAIIKLSKQPDNSDELIRYAKIFKYQNAATAYSNLIDSLI